MIIQIIVLILIDHQFIDLETLKSYKEILIYGKLNFFSENFIYNSNNNTQWMTKDELKKWIKANEKDIGFF